MLEATFAGVVPAALRWPLEQAAQGPTAVSQALRDAWGAKNLVAAVASGNSGAEDAQSVRHDATLSRRLLCHLLKPLAFELLCGVNTLPPQLIADHCVSSLVLRSSAGPCSSEICFNHKYLLCRCRELTIERSLNEHPFLSLVLSLHQRLRFSHLTDAWMRHLVQNGQFGMSGHVHMHNLLWIAAHAPKTA